jgi:geranylgeranyl transferase type-2 subunit beta
VGHDPHITNTLYALLILAMYDDVQAIDTNKLIDYVVSLQTEDGAFRGDHGGEIDARFSYCAVSALSLLGQLDRINREKARDFLLSCKNIDGSFGGVPGAESHAAYAFCTVGALKILGDIDLIDKDKLGLWLSKR